MALSEWIMIALGVVILIADVLLFLRYRRELRKNDDFEGIITERGRMTRRSEAEILKEIERLEEKLVKKS